jgi:hypothetical protein
MTCRMNATSVHAAGFLGNTKAETDAAYSESLTKVWL